MKRIIVIGEGQTEQSFCNDLLQSHFNKKSIYIENPTIKKTHGGIVNWEALKFQIKNHLKQDSTAIVTTLIDYYGIYEHHDYPEWKDSQGLVDKSERLTKIETAMKNDIDVELQGRFIPYIQLHEFEALLFSEIEVFKDNFTPQEFKDYPYLQKTIDDNPNPETINDGNETAPSKRLEKIIRGYRSDKESLKVIYGSLLAQEIGLTKIRAKCSRFNSWILKLESI